MAKTKSADNKENTEFKLENLNDKDDSADSSSESELEETEKETGGEQQNPVIFRFVSVPVQTRQFTKLPFGQSHIFGN
jgi:hypothetical protein